jgi:hypothetical protein
MKSRRDLFFLGAGVLAALAFRAGALSQMHLTYDMTSWQIAYDILQRGGDLYRETGRYNYSPLWAGLLWILGRGGAVFGLSLIQAVSIFLIAVDAGTAIVIWKIGTGRGMSSGRAGLAALLFFANPISILVSSDLLTFDNLSILFLLCGLWCLERRPASPAGAVGSLSFSLLAKHITWFHPLLFAARRRGARLGWAAALVPYLVFMLSFLPFWRSRQAIRAHVFDYRGLDEVYGTEPLRHVQWLPRETTTVLFVLASFAAIFWLRGVELGRASLLLFLVLLIFTPGICPYYFVWPVALGALYPGMGFAVYTAVVTAFFIHSPDVLAQEIPHLPGWWGVWFAVILWLLWELRGLRKIPIDSMAEASH